MKENTTLSGDITKLCRLCLKKSTNLIDLFSLSLKLGGRIVDVIERCTPVRIGIRHEKLPNVICKLCYVELDRVQFFLNKALQSEKALQKYLRQLDPGYESPKDNTSIKNDSNDDDDTNRSWDETSADQDTAPASTSNTESANFSANLILKCEYPEQLVKTHFEETFNNLPLSAVKQDTVHLTNPVPSSGDSSTTFKSSKEKKILQCEVCNKIFTQAKHLKVHKRIHTGAKPFQCDSCGKCFGREDNLRTHKRLHTGVKPFKCTICSKCFSREDHVRTHMRSHSGKRPYQCDICGKCFTQCGLKTHKLLHEGEKSDKSIKPYKCDVCNKSFSKPIGLKTHKLIHSPDKRYRCSYCNKGYSQTSNLKKHMFIHTGEKPYRCDVCNECFTQISHLKTHKLKHTGEKPYRCDVCYKGFTSACVLKRHKLVHAGENQFQCDLCDKSYSQLVHLTVHKGVHTGENSYQ